MSALDEYTRSLMSPTELEAIEDPNYDTGEEADSTEDDDSKSDAADESAEQDSQPVEGKAPPPPAEAPAESSEVDEDAPAPAEPAEPAPASQFVPRYEAVLPSDYQAKLDDLTTKEADLKAKLKAGDIDFDAYDTEREELSRERSALERAAVKAEISQEMTQQTAQQQWTNTVNGFLSRVKSELDYASDPQKWDDLDQFVKVLANNPAYNDKPPEWFLTEGHRRVQALHGLSTPAAKDSPPAPPPSPKQVIDKAKAARKPAVAAVQASLAQVPGGDGPGDVSDEFVDVDSLEGFALEDAIKRMSPEQRERYLKG